MGTADWPMAITSGGRARVCLVGFRQGQQLYVAVIVKGTFALVAEGPMAPVEADSIVADGDAQRGPSDLVPYVRQVDVWLVGHARGGAPPLTVRLGVFRDGGALMN